MDIFVIAAEGSERGERFHRFAAEQGCTLHRGLVREALLDPGQVGKGVIVFGDSERSLAAALAQARASLRYLDVFLVGVGTDADRERLQAAGADVVCDEGAEDGAILAEVQGGGPFRAVAGAVRDPLLESFISAADMTLREWATTDVVVRAVYQHGRHQTFGEVAAVIPLLSAPEESLVLSCPEPTAATLAGRILARPVEELDDALIRDCLGEIANVVAGHAKALLAETPYRFTLSTPRSLGRAETGSTPARDCLIAAFGSDAGDFALQLFLKQ